MHSGKYVFEESCADWDKVTDKRYTKGIYQPHIPSDEMCRKSCLAFKECEAFDWAPDSDRKCSHHHIGIGSAPELEKGSYYWKIKQRRGLCYGMISDNQNQYHYLVCN